jgi:hypothetical protein
MLEDFLDALAADVLKPAGFIDTANLLGDFFLRILRNLRCISIITDGSPFDRMRATENGVELLSIG